MMSVQQMLTMYLHQLGVDMPPQRIMECAVELLDDLGEIDNPHDYFLGVVELIAMLVLTGEFSGKRDIGAEAGGDLPRREG